MDQASRIVARTAAFICVISVALLARPATAAELAILRNGFSIRHEHHLAMGATTRLYFAADDSSFTDVPTEDISGYEKDLSLYLPADAYASMNTPFDSGKFGSAKSGSAQFGSMPALNEVVNTASAAYHLDPDLVTSVIHAESGFNVHAISPKGARGLMQLMPGTANELGVNDAFDPQANVTGGSHYLRDLLERYNFDLVKALAAYNAGPERVEQYRGVPPFRETRAYVARVVHEYNTKKIAQEKAAKLKPASARGSGRVTSNGKTHAGRAVKPSATTIAAEPPR